MQPLHESIYAKNKKTTKKNLKLTPYVKKCIAELSSQVEVPTLNQVIEKIGSGNLEKCKVIHRSIKAKRLQLAKELQGTLPGVHKTEQQGFIYLIKNPLHIGWIKCGMTIDCRNRLKSYNGYDPTSGFSFIATKPVVNRHKAERRLLHEVSMKASLRNGEWFKIDENLCLEIFSKIS